MPILLEFCFIFALEIVPHNNLKLSIMSDLLDVRSLAESFDSAVFVVYCVEFDKCRILGVYKSYEHAKRIFDAHKECACYFQSYHLDVYDLIKD